MTGTPPRAISMASSLFLALAAATVAAAEPPRAAWVHPLDRDGGGMWRRRIPYEIRNDSDRPLAGRLVVAAAPAALRGAEAGAVRVVDAAGRELLFVIVDALGRPVTSGPIPDRATLTIPAECPARGTASGYVYLDNPDADPVLDALRARPGVANGDVERGRGDAPEGWTHDAADASHRASWSDERAHGGRKCLKLEVAAGAEPTWISTRQRDVEVEAGARYRFTGWVRARDVVGEAGWYLHVGSPQDPMMLAPMFRAGAGTFEWTRVQGEFTAPEGAVSLELGTVLRGTGVAWFDDAQLERLDPPTTRATFGAEETLPVVAIGDGPASWSPDGPDRRLVVRVAQLEAPPAGSPPAQTTVDLSLLRARTRGKLDLGSIRVLQGAKVAPHSFLGDRLVFAAAPPAPSLQTFRIEFEAARDAAAAAPRTTGTIGNLLSDPGFEEGGAAWTRSGQGPGVRFDLDADAGGSGRAGRLVVAPDAPAEWRGWIQEVRIRPGRTYLIAARLKAGGLTGGDASIHIHFADADGRICEDGGMTSVGPGIGATTDWTTLAGTVVAPRDAASLRIHLTTNHTGTLWHDDAVVAEAVPSRAMEIEHRSDADPSAPVQVWSVPPVVKVFPDDAPAAGAPTGLATASAARNEHEPIQIAIRSASARANVKVEVGPLVGPGGFRLPAPDVKVVGYVPIDHPSGYFQSHSPSWQRRTPGGGAQCDGWAGTWPDPLLPPNAFDLKPRETRTAWLTVTVPADAPAGEFQGEARFLSDGRPLGAARITFRVWDYAIPDRPSFRAIYDARFGPAGFSDWASDAADARGRITAAMRERRTCPDTIGVEPRFRFVDGRASADFEAFDRAAGAYFDRDDFAHSYAPMAFYGFGWGMPPSDFLGEHPYPGDPPYEKADRRTLRPEYKRAYQECLRLFWDHVKSRGWADRFTLYISDEPFYSKPEIRDQMIALCAMIHEVDPAIPIYSSTWRHVPEWDGSLDVWGLGHDGMVPVETLKKIRAGGAKFWWTVDGMMCLDTPYCAVERLLPYLAFEHGAEAYEFWGVSWHTRDPYQAGWHAYIPQSDAPGVHYWIRYPNGDGYLLYPGGPIGLREVVSTVRMEQARDGEEDYETLLLLRGLTDAARAAGEDVRDAEAALAAVSRLAAIPNSNGRYSTRLLPDPDALDHAREAASAVVERLVRAGVRPAAPPRR